MPICPVAVNMREGNSSDNFIEGLNPDVVLTLFVYVVKERGASPFLNTQVQNGVEEIIQSIFFGNDVIIFCNLNKKEHHYV